MTQCRSQKRFDDDSPNREVEVFTEALRLNRCERTAYLGRACGGDNELRQRIESLLEANERAGDFLEDSPETFSPPARPELQRSLAVGMGRVVRTLPCREVIEERNRMAREIHDTLAQEFAGILLHLEAATGLDNPEGQNICTCVARAKELAKCGLQDARRMLLGLRPKSLEGTHLRDALKQLAENFSRDCGIQCSFCLRGQPNKLPEDAEDELYRVAQEALCNVRKHSRARSVSILLRYSSGGVLLTIKDNGQGFVVKKPQAGPHGFGLPAMSDRALRLGGRVDINSRLGAGTELKMILPVHGTSTERNNQ